MTYHSRALVCALALGNTGLKLSEGAGAGSPALQLVETLGRLQLVPCSAQNSLVDQGSQQQECSTQQLLMPLIISSKPVHHLCTANGCRVWS